MDMSRLFINACRLCRIASALMISLLAGKCLLRTAGAAEMFCGGGPPAKPADLTGLSLEELYNLDIVQPNVLGGHTHPEGQMMFGYEYMHVTMKGIYQGQSEISPQQAFAEGFGTVHIDMEMNMQMFDFMYAPTERLTVMGMLPYKSMTMMHERSDGSMFTQQSDGIGDVEVMGMYTFFGDILKGGNRLILNAGLSLPTGAIDVHDHNGGDASKEEDLLEYPMQLGTGTLDLMPGLTYLGDSGEWSWGAQTIETVRTGRNYHGYRVGNEYRISGWASYAVADWFAPSLRLDGRDWGNISGSDPGLATNVTPEARPNLRAGRRLDMLFGLNFYAGHGLLKGTRFMVEGGIPVYQYLTGPQLGTAWMISAGVTYAF